MWKNWQISLTSTMLKQVWVSITFVYVVSPSYINKRKRILLWLRSILITPDTVFISDTEPNASNKRVYVEAHNSSVMTWNTSDYCTPTPGVEEYHVIVRKGTIYMAIECVKWEWHFLWYPCTVSKEVNLAFGEDTRFGYFFFLLRKKERNLLNFSQFVLIKLHNYG